MNKENNNKKINPFSLMEEEVLDFWDKSKIFEKSIKKEAPQGDYVFYDGPPFATGLPHYGHIVASVIKDVVPRYWTMKGYRVERKWGWDCHGLPIENIVEKEIGSQSKKYIEEEIGVEKFNEMCRSKVLSYVDEWKKVIHKLGRWADMENPYKTMDLEFMESVWWAFKELWDNDLIYKGYRSMHVCPRCETTLSQSEVTEGYKDIKDLSAIAKFELIDEPGTYVLAWTTTPWTLIGNVALAVGVDIDYVKAIKKDSEDKSIFILAKEKVDQVLKDDYEVIEEFKGSDLLNKAYKPLFDYYSEDEKIKNKENGWKIYAGDFVSTEEGTGIVHIAPAFGEDDMELGKKNNLPFVQHLEMDGNFKKEVKDFYGLNVKPKDNHMSTDIEIIKYLAHNNLLFAKEKYEHSYPHCWRCDTPLINYATSSWFVKVKELKEGFLEYAKDINWSPDHIKKGRWGNWLEGARDWSISRQRFWASVMPIWECECGERKVFGSVKELEEASGEKIKDLHKHVVDKIVLKCEKCGQAMKRIPDVLDTWFDSGSMPYAQMHYPFTDKEKFEKNFPAEFIAEGSDQCRCWFYYMHIIAAGIMKKRAFNNVIVNGIVLAEDGKKMSKKLQNYPDPVSVLDVYGADALRQYLLNSPVMLADNLCFSEDGVKEAKRKNIMLVWNVYKFYEMFARETISEKGKIESDNVLDKWILARLGQLIKTVTEEMDKYNLPLASRPITDFIDDLSTWYIRRSRDRFKGDDKEDRDKALAVTGFVLKELAKVIAPFMPFIAEQVWQKVTGNDFKDENKSVHLELWPEHESMRTQEHKNIRTWEHGNMDIINDMEKVRKIVELGLSKRDEASIKVRQPLSQLRIKNYGLKEEYIDLVKDELNIKEAISEEGDGDISVELDTEISPELELEGIKREIVRSINVIRKEKELSIGDRVLIYYQSPSEKNNKAIEDYKDEIIKETLADDILKGETEKDLKINGEPFSLGVKKN
jgi:isoleucyl-tRNA synthetase